MPIGEYPILEVIVKQLVKHGFTSITMAVNHQADLIKAFFGDGSKWNIRISYSLENQPLGTMGPLKLMNDLPENFLVMNGDILTDLSFSNFYESHINSNKIFTISSFKREQLIDYGVLKIDSNNNLEEFTEKPKNYFEVSMGIYMLNKKILEYIPTDKTFGFDNLMLKLLSQNIYVGINSFDGFWLDIGRPDDYIEAIEKFDSMKHKFLNE